MLVFVTGIEPKPWLLVNPSMIESSDFDCVLCCRTLFRPVVTPCGHTYCWVRKIISIFDEFLKRTNCRWFKNLLGYASRVFSELTSLTGT
jgi:hypothetical protein